LLNGVLWLRTANLEPQPAGTYRALPSSEGQRDCKYDPKRMSTSSRFAGRSAIESRRTIRVSQPRPPPHSSSRRSCWRFFWRSWRLICTELNCIWSGSRMKRTPSILISWVR